MILTLHYLKNLISLVMEIMQVFLIIIFKKLKNKYITYLKKGLMILFVNKNKIIILSLVRVIAHF